MLGVMLWSIPIAGSPTYRHYVGERFHPTPLRMMIFGNSFEKVSLDVSEDFIVKSGLEEGEAHIIDMATIRRILKDYEKEYAKPVFSNKKEPFNSLKKQLSRLGILCVEHLEKDAYNEQDLSEIRLSLRSPKGKVVTCFSRMKEQKIDASKFGHSEHTLIDGHLLLYDDYVERILRISKDRENRVILDMSDLPVVKELSARFWYLLSQVDVLFFSAESANIFTGMGTPLDACKFLSRFRKLVVIRDESSALFFISDPSSPGICRKNFSSKEKAELFQTGFMFGYLNGARPEYCVSCAESLSSEESLA